MTTIARTLAYLRRLGFLAAPVEVYLPHAQRHRDLFGIADVFAVHPRDRLLLLVQATTAAHVPDRLRRVQARPELPGLLRGGVQVEVWGWQRRDGRWRLRRVAVRAEDRAVEVQALPRRRTRKGERQRQLFA